MTQQVRADEILHALAKTHEGNNNFFMTQVKNGPTQMAKGGELLIIDGLAIRKSWANPCFIGYEVKVSRSDFTRDAKWHLYAQYCHQLYLVCPKGLVEKHEVYDHAGLIWYNPETGALSWRKRAEHRKINISANMLMYIIMSKLESDRHPFFSQARDEFAALVADRQERKQLGHNVGRKWIELQYELEKVRRDMKPYRDAKDALQEVVDVMERHGIQTWSQQRIAANLDAALAKGGGQAKLERIDSILGGIKNSVETAKKLIEQTQVGPPEEVAQ